MQTRTFERVGDFLAKAQSHLEREEAANSLMLGVALSLKDSTVSSAAPSDVGLGRQREPAHGNTPRKEPPQARPLLLLVEGDKKPCGAVIMTPPRQAMLWASGSSCADAMTSAATRICADGWALPGALGEATVAKAFVEAWSQVSSQSYREHTRLRVHEARRVNRIPPAPGRARVATPADLEVAAAWAVAFEAEALGKFADPARARETMASRVNRRELLLWENAEPVSMASRVRPTAHGASIGAVYTPPPFRGRGYATSCVAALTQYLLSSGREFCCLYTDLANPVSNSIYRKIGYLPVCDWTEYTFGK